MSRLLTPLALSVLLAPAALAQGSFGIGGQLGDPSGLALKFGRGPSAIDLAAEWDFEDYVLVQGHYLLAERRVPGSSARVNYFYGPGAFVATNGEATAAGFSFNLGLNYYTGPLELFAQLTPRLQLVEETDGDIGAAIGLRFYP